MRLPRSLVPIFSSTVIFGGCANSQPLAPPEAPPALRPPAGQSLSVEAVATGVQIYECSRKADATYEWTFKAPEASLVSRGGEPVGQHFAGPTWESIDGSTVVGEVKAKDPGPTTSAIPWLLLSAKANTGPGAFGAIKSVQRLATVGGLPPNEPCTGRNLGEVGRIPYSATYYFYR